MTVGHVLRLEAGRDSPQGSGAVAGDPELGALAALIEGAPGSEALLPAGSVACIARIGDAASSPFAEEAATAARFAPKRRREFLTGRACARGAMAGLGHPPQAIGIRPDGSPYWPEGIAGSISHTAELCMAVVGTRPCLASIGVDLEPVHAWFPPAAALVLTGAELQRYGDTDRAAAVFAMKEAYMKARYPLIGGLIDFRDVEIDLHADCRGWSAHLLDPLVPTLPAGARFISSVRQLSGLVLAIAAIALPAGRTSRALPERLCCDFAPGRGGGSVANATTKASSVSC